MDDKDFVFMLQKIIDDIDALVPNVLTSAWDEGFYTAVVKIKIRIQKDIDLVNDWIKQE